MKKKLILLATLLIMVPLVGCGGESSDNEDEDRVSIEEPDTISEDTLDSSDDNLPGFTAEESALVRDVCRDAAVQEGVDPNLVCSDESISEILQTSNF